MKKRRKVRKHTDPYREAQAKQRRSANVARQDLLRQQAAASLGDPIRSRPTPFVESLQTTAPIDEIKESYLNYFVKPSELEQSIARSAALTTPREIEGDYQNNEERAERFQAEHENAMKAMHRIADLNNASQKDRTRINVMRCIEEFGRHNTDQILPPKPTSSQQPDREGVDVEGLAAVPKRSGPDTGSSEVQVAIFTAKINVMATNMGLQDKIGKRNLRLLVHKRQKHLKYLRRKERGGPRWLNLVEKLGINDGMWKGEITV